MKARFSFLLLFVLVAAGIAFRASTSTNSSATNHDKSGDASPPLDAEDHPSPETTEEKHRRLLAGGWEDEYQGKRTMTLKEDGTGTMVVELAGVQASLFAPRLRFDMQWSLSGDTLTKTTVGGEPAKKVNLILKMMGDVAEDKILEITDERLLLLDQDGKTEYDWRRVPRDEPGKAR